MSDRPLEGKVAIVTGSGRGLGRAIAVGLAKAGADLVLAARSEDQLRDAADEVAKSGGRVITVPTDITKVEQVDHMVARAVEELGGVDVLVNNSGTYVARKLIHMSDDEWDLVLDTNLRGVFLCTRAVGRHFNENREKGGVVVNIASNLAVVGRSHFTSYCASKAAVTNFTKALALEWAPMNARVNCIAPGYFETEFNAELREDADATAGVVKGIPQGRMATPSELTPLVVYLASSASSFVTGETIVIDGGETLD